MVDVLTEAQHQLNMSHIRGRDTKPEMLIRWGGMRGAFVTGLPGRPDLVFPLYKAVILVQSCFWHGYDYPMFRLPATHHESGAEKRS